MYIRIYFFSEYDLHTFTFISPAWQMYCIIIIIRIRCKNSMLTNSPPYTNISIYVYSIYNT